MKKRKEIEKAKELSLRVFSQIQTKGAFLGALVALLLSASAIFKNFPQPYAVTGGAYSDHFSHMAATILFYDKGLDIYRFPVQKNLVQSKAEKDIDFAKENHLGTQELYINPVNPERPPLPVNWSFQIRPYPPGLYALLAPFAFCFHQEILSFKFLCQAIILMLLMVSLAATASLTHCALESPRERATTITRLVAAGLASYWSCLWALRGFYDVTALLLVYCALHFLYRRKWLDSLFWYCLAIFMHYRALYYLPVIAFSIAGYWQQFGRPGVLAAFRNPKTWIALCCALISGLCFFVALPQLESFGGNNILYHLSRLSDGNSTVIAALLLASASAAAMLWNKDVQTASFLACFWVFLIRTPQTYPWHTLFMVPLVVYSVRNRFSYRSALQSTLILSHCVYLAYFVYSVRWGTLS